MADRDEPRSRPSVSIATLTIVVSRIDMIVPSTTTDASRINARSRPITRTLPTASEMLPRMPSVSAQYAIILRVEIDHRPGMLGRVATAIGDAGGSIGAVDLVALEGGHTLRDITIETAGGEHARQIGEGGQPPRPAQGGA